MEDKTRVEEKSRRKVKKMDCLVKEKIGGNEKVERKRVGGVPKKKKR